MYNLTSPVSAIFVVVVMRVAFMYIETQRSPMYFDTSSIDVSRHP